MDAQLAKPVADISRIMCLEMRPEPDIAFAGLLIHLRDVGHALFLVQQQRRFYNINHKITNINKSNNYCMTTV
jgi:hypothetical protein